MCGQAGSLLVHHIPDQHLRPSHVAMASTYVSDRVCERLLNPYHPLDLRSFLAASPGAGDAMRELRGDLFESFCHILLSRGGDFAVRYPDTGAQAAQPSRCALRG